MPDHSSEDAGPKHAAEQPAAARPPRIRSGRRARTDPPPGSDPAPFPEPARHLADENDDRLKRDKPPHWA